jgi:DNA recombination protein RmuC
MNNPQFFLLVALNLAGLAAVLWLALRLGRLQRENRDALGAPLAELERKLADAFAKANADMAARVEQIKGDLRADLTERFQQGFNEVRDAVDNRLQQGRVELTQSLGGAAAGLDQKFELLRAATEQKLESQAQRQGDALRESRAEQSKSLTDLAKGLQDRFDQWNQAQTAASRAARDELAQSLNLVTQQLIAKFEALESKTTQNLELLRGKVDERLQTISEQVQQKLEKNIQEGFAHFQKVQEHLKAAEEQLRQVGTVGQSINELNNLLKMPHLRGKFGEAELARLLSDFLPAGAYGEQVGIVPGSAEKVDAVVYFPKVKLPIDSKFNREQILPLFETNDPAMLAEARKQLATVIKGQARDIQEKYIHPEHGTAELALMFLPSETVYFEVIRDLELCEALHKCNVFPVSPNTLAITLKSIAMSFSYYEFAKNVEKTLEQIKQAQKNFAFFQKKFEEVGKGLQKAQEAFGTASTHLNRYTNRVTQLTGEPLPEIAADPAVDGPEPAK